MKYFYISFFCSLLFFACKKESKLEFTKKDLVAIPFDYATNFSVDSSSNGLIYTIKNGETENKITLNYGDLPFENIVTTSSSAVGFLDAIGKTKAITAAYDADWIYSEKLHEQIENKYTRDLGNSNGMNLEQIINLKPDAVVVFSDANRIQLYKQIEDSGIKVIFVDEYMEQTPLGRAEYIKLFGLLTGEFSKAKEVFHNVEHRYLSLMNQVESVEEKPTILSNVMRGDVWYLPGGQSFSAQFFKDAGGDYLWGDTLETGSLALDFESVLNKAEEANYWLNASDFKTLSDLDAAYKNHHWFNAFQNGQVYSFSKRVNSKGANDFFETGPVRPDLVLKDLISILHPNSLSHHELYFYQKLN